MITLIYYVENGALYIKDGGYWRLADPHWQRFKYKIDEDLTCLEIVSPSGFPFNI